MSKTQDNSANASAGMMGMGDISVIRNILFGQQAAEFETKVGEILARLDRTDSANQQQFEKLEKDLRTALADLTAQTDARFKALEAKLEQNTAQLADSIRQTSTQDKAMLGQMLLEIGKKLGA